MLRRICFTLLCSLIVSIEVYSIGASPFAVKIKQSDGTEITVKPHGDERKRWFTTNDGYRVIRNGEGVFEFAQEGRTGEVVLSGLKAADISKRSDTVRQFLKSIPKNLGATSSELKSATTTSDISLKNASASTTGNFKLLVISHTDSQGDDDRNLKLSIKRSETVISYLSSIGIKMDRLKAEGKGEKEIRNRCVNGVDCSDKEHEYNRRTEFKFSKK